MKRRLFTILSALSLLLCAAVVGMWVRSYWWWETITYRYAHRQYTLGSGSGTLIAILAEYSGDDRRQPVRGRGTAWAVLAPVLRSAKQQGRDFRHP